MPNRHWSKGLELPGGSETLLLQPENKARFVMKHPVYLMVRHFLYTGENSQDLHLVMAVQYSSRAMLRGFQLSTQFALRNNNNCVHFWIEIFCEKQKNWQDFNDPFRR